jgi:hypothetical protein
MNLKRTKRFKKSQWIQSTQQDNVTTNWVTAGKQEK